MSEPDFHFTFHFSNFQYPLSQGTAPVEHQPPIQQLIFTKSAVVSFIKFELLEFYGNDGGLQILQLPNTIIKYG